MYPGNYQSLVGPDRPHQLRDYETKDHYGNTSPAGLLHSKIALYVAQPPLFYCTYTLVGACGHVCTNHTATENEVALCTRMSAQINIT